MLCWPFRKLALWVFLPHIRTFHRSRYDNTLQNILLSRHFRLSTVGLFFPLKGNQRNVVYNCILLFTGIELVFKSILTWLDTQVVCCRSYGLSHSIVFVEDLQASFIMKNRNIALQKRRCSMISNSWISAIQLRITLEKAPTWQNRKQLKKEHRSSLC